MFYVNTRLTLRTLWASVIALSYGCHPAPAQEVQDGHPGYAKEVPVYPKDVPLDTEEDSYAVRSVSRETRYFSVTVSDAGPSHYADVVFQNELTHDYYVHNTINFTRPDGLIITVIFDMGDGSAPDVMVVVPPPGYIAIPEEVSVEEGAVGIIEIHAATYS